MALSLDALAPEHDHFQEGDPVGGCDRRAVVPCPLTIYAARVKGVPGKNANGLLMNYRGLNYPMGKSASGSSPLRVCRLRRNPRFRWP